MAMSRNLTTLVSYPDRGNGGRNTYRGNCSPLLIEDLISHFKIKQISDYMCGSGTTADAAKTMGIESSCYDLHSGFDLINCEIPERPEFIFHHPPYHDVVVYSGNMYDASEVERKYGYDPKKSDLSRIGTWDDFVKTMNYCIMKQYTALTKGGRMAILVGDIKKKGKLYSMILEMIKPGTLENVIIKAQHNCVSNRRSYNGKFIPIAHEYLVLLRKDTALLCPVLETRSREWDMRDMQGITWKDLVASVLEDTTGKRACLTDIYASIEPHKKALANRHWREKVRQTLQMHPIFRNVERGIWALQQCA